MKLSIAFSEACNLDCSYCNVDKNSTKTINIDIFLTEFYKLRAQTQEKITIDFYGGEPLIHYQKIKTIIETIKNDNVKFFMPTNGLLLTDEILNYLNLNNVDISLSFDGLWQSNRTQLNGTDTLPKYLNNKLFNNLTVHSMIYKGNYNLLENHLYITKNFTNPWLTIIRDRGVWDTGSVKLLNEGITELFEWYILNSYEDMPNFIFHFFKSVILYKAKDVKKTSCGAGDTHLSFTDDKVIPCNRFNTEYDLINNIDTFNLEGLSDCDDCKIANYCEKGCLYENMKNGGVIKEVCDIYKHIYSEIDRMLYILQDDKHLIKIIKKEVNNEF